METIGTKPQEDDSYNIIIILMATFTVGIVLSTAIEMALYFLYNMKVE